MVKLSNLALCSRFVKDEWFYDRDIYHNYSNNLHYNRTTKLLVHYETVIGGYENGVVYLRDLCSHFKNTFSKTTSKIILLIKRLCEEEQATLKWFHYDIELMPFIEEMKDESNRVHWKKKKYSKICKNVPNDFKCSICLEENKDNVVITKCKHYFHKDCLKIWTDNHMSCPLCKTSFN